jgi:hypothetical protein
MDIKINDLKKYLSNSSEKELRNQIVELFKISKEVKEYYLLKLSPDSEKELMDKYKKIIENEFFPERGMKFPSYPVLKKAVSDFQKISKNPIYVAELMLFYVEKGVEFTNTYGDINETFYNNIGRMFEKAVDYVVENALKDIFENRCKKIMEGSVDIGWGFGDFISDYYYENFEF